MSLLRFCICNTRDYRSSGVVRCTIDIDLFFYCCLWCASIFRGEGCLVTCGLYFPFSTRCFLYFSHPPVDLIVWRQQKLLARIFQRVLRCKPPPPALPVHASCVCHLCTGALPGLGERQGCAGVGRWGSVVAQGFACHSQQVRCTRWNICSFEL